MQFVRNIRVVAASALPFVLSSLPVCAEEAGAGEKGGLPQLDASLFPSQLFWLAVSFALLYVLMSMVALPRVARTQANRKDVIAAEIEAAREASETAKETVAAVERSLGEARAKAQADVNDIIAAVTAEETTRRAAQEKELQNQLHHAEADIAVAREAALKEVQASAAELAKDVVNKILGIKGRVNA